MKMLTTTLLASSLIFLPVLASMPAAARPGVTVDFGNVGIGYRDGYYDRGHQYHRWHRNDAVAYRTQYHDHYRDMYHNRDHNRSWDH
jgi:5-formyltetrahydrofolate cyclo-ligase